MIDSAFAGEYIKFPVVAGILLFTGAISTAIFLTDSIKGETKAGSILFVIFALILLPVDFVILRNYPLRITPDTLNYTLISVRILIWMFILGVWINQKRKKPLHGEGDYVSIISLVTYNALLVYYNF